MPQHLLAVGLGGALGACARYLATRGIVRFASTASLPWATMVVNVVGSFLLGWLLAALAADRVTWAASLPLDARLLFGVGFLGAFTTFSTFALETVTALRLGETGVALTNIIASVVLSIAACWLGVVLGSR